MALCAEVEGHANSRLTSPIASAARASASINRSSSALPVATFAPDQHQHRDRQRTHPLQIDVKHCAARPVEQVGQSPDIGHPRPRIVPRRLEQQMARLVLAQHVVDQVGGKGHLPPGLALAGMLALDQPADHRDLAECAFQKVRLLHPVDELVFEDVGEKRLAGSVTFSSP